MGLNHPSRASAGARSTKIGARADRDDETIHPALSHAIATHCIVFRRSADGRILYLSNSVADILGYRPEELDSGFYQLLTDQPINQAMYEATETALAGEIADPYEIEISSRTGEIKRLRIIESRVPCDGCGVGEIQGIAEDVTDQHLSTVLLDGRNEVLRGLAQGTPQKALLDAICRMTELADPAVAASILILDPERRRLMLASANRLPEQYNRAVDGALIGDGVGSCGTAAFRNEPVVVADVLTHPYWADFREIIAETGLRACWSHPIRARDNRVLGVFGMYYRTRREPNESSMRIIESAADLASVVLEHLNARKALEAAEERQRLLLDSSTDGIFGIGPDGRTTFINPAAAAMLGFEIQELTGIDPHQLIHRTPRTALGRGEARACKMLAPAFDGLVRHVKDEVLYRRDGSQFPVEYWSNPIYKGDQIVGAVVTFRDLTEQRANEQKIHRVAFYDALTDLPNRIMFYERVGQEIARLKRHQTAFTIHQIDLDHFKDINETLGHAAGDELLQLVAARLRAHVREEDLVSRLGGDEFAVLQTGQCDPVAAARLAKRIIADLTRPFQVGEHSIYIGTSIGIVIAQDSATDAGILLAQADVALYRAKSQGRGRCVFYEAQMGEELKMEMDVLNAFPRAIQEKQLTIVYQPQIDLGTGRLCGVEALVRWTHPVMGVLSPAVFVPVLERRGSIGLLDRYVLSAASEQCRRWLDMGFDFGRISVNISAFDVRDVAGLEGLVDLIRIAGAPLSAMELEFTERMLIQIDGAIADCVERLGLEGLKFAIDDFGTGYSSMTYLRRLRVKGQDLKIDRSFIAEMLSDENDAEIVKATIALGRSLGMNLVAEGVETLEQRQFLIDHGCHGAQGYLFARPLTPTDLIDKFGNSVQPKRWQ
jgi:diguanylate cyclase (GGDEF)-like protein/PAS domain S-box-containing protein